MKDEAAKYWPSETILKYHIAYGLLFLSTFGFLVGARGLTRDIFSQGPPTLHDFASLCFGILILPAFMTAGYFYDLTLGLVWRFTSSTT